MEEGLIPHRSNGV